MSLFEDYFLWVRMLLNGSKFANIQESLLFFRTSPQMYKRRGGWGYAWVEAKFMLMIYRQGYLGCMEAIMNIMRRFPIRVMPNRVRNFIYQRFIRK